METKPYVSLIKINKSFPGVKALTDVSIDFFPGKVHVLLGENGAGKSTIIKVISGVYKAESGKLIIDGEEKNFNDISESIEAGISVIHQELSVVPDLTVAENIFLGREPKMDKFGIIDKNKINRDAQEILNSIGVDINPREYIRKLNNGDRQMVEIARAISKNSSMVIMDEPTSSLSNKEVESLFKVIEKLKKENVAIIYITHRLKEIIEIGDTVTILRDGEEVKTANIADLSESEMISLMVGRNVTKFQHKGNSINSDEVVLEVKNLNSDRFKNISFQLHKGEILGFAGLIGAGRTELMRAIFGADKYYSGEIKLFNKSVKFKTPRDAINAGIGLIPENRRDEGLLLEKNVIVNSTLPSVQKTSKYNFIDFKWEKNITKEYIELLKTKTPSENSIVKNLSGGNQQKIIIARWLIAESEILIMDEPTRGIDVNAKSEIYLLMKKFVESGGSIILVSSDLPEIIGISDRIVVMREGEISGIVDGEGVEENDLMKLASLNISNKEVV
ncbi:MAG: sugar ABC transporter ATP-binding protein [Miniphocaeibacter sp.]|uniref:sugar ABC transporter ATP-binding protein n=1 Tax=Miniphocaeibacter sp. TaxID=3100973 RepID=UPI0017CF1C8E|nr:sugar ABC transporter ATP-binding protein [Gallicola sp.]